MSASARTALTTSALVAGYERDLPIVRGIDFSVSQGELVAILGPNGAGKSTFVKAIAGLVPVFSGTASLGDVEITHEPVHRRVRHGLGFVPQTENIFASLSIDDNLQLAADILPKPDRQPRIAEVKDRFPDLASRPSRRAGQLSGGQRQMLAVARALIAQPSLLVLDEPSAGLSPKIVADVFRQLKTINQSGVTIVLVEQNVKAALGIADRAYILVEGRVKHEGQAARLADDPMVAELYLGVRATEAS